MIISRCLHIRGADQSSPKASDARWVQEAWCLPTFVILGSDHTTTLEQHACFVHMQTPRDTVPEKQCRSIRYVTTPSSCNLFQGTLIGRVLKVLIVLSRTMIMMTLGPCACRWNTCREVAPGGVRIEVVVFDLLDHLFHQRYWPRHGISAVGEHTLVLARGEAWSLVNGGRGFSTAEETAYR